MAMEIGALSHLVEAATALANMDNTASMAADTAAETSTGLLQECRPVVQEGEQLGITESNQSAGAGSHCSNVLPQVLNKGKREIFPQRLLAVLNDPSLSDVVSWLPHGRSFVIIRPDVFTEKVMPTYFPPVDARASTKYPSFTRKLNRWGFRQATRGPDTGAFHHPLFRRDRPELCVDMVCQRSRATPAKAQAKKQQQQQRAAAAAEESPVKVAPLTKESIDQILPSTYTSFGKTTATVSMDEARSEISDQTLNSVGSSIISSSSRSASSTLPVPIKQSISTDKAFVDMTIRHRDEMERLRVAQAMLYKAFTSALQEHPK